MHSKVTIMLKDILGRKLQIGDLVLINLSSKGSNLSRYGLVCGETQIFSYNKVTSYGSRDKNCYLIENPSEDEYSFKRILTKNYNEETRKNMLLSLNKDSLSQIPLEVGNVYIDKSEHLYIYLGKCKIYVHNIDVDLNSVVTSGTHCFLRCTSFTNFLYTTSNTLDDEFSLDDFKHTILSYRDIKTLSFNYLLFSLDYPTRFVKFIKKVKVTGLPHTGVFKNKFYNKNFQFTLEQI